jgi:hypothetical protein
VSDNTNTSASSAGAVATEKPTEKKKRSDKANSDGSQASILVDIAKKAECRFWHNPEGVPFVTIPVGRHVEHRPIGSKSFRQWLAERFYRMRKSTAGTQAIQDATRVLEARAVFDGPEHDTPIRVAEHDGAIYLDLCDSDWRAVEVRPAAWSIVNPPPVYFRRCKAMAPLPGPAADGSIEDLRRLVNVTDEDWPLLAAWLVAALRPVGPYPVLCLP